MFIEGTILGLIVGKFRGGRLGNLEYIELRGWPLAVLAFFLQIAPWFLGRIEGLNEYMNYSYAASMILLMIALVINLDKRGLWMLMAGVILNFIAIYFGGFKMPISANALELAGLQPMLDGIRSGNVVNYELLGDTIHWSRYLAKMVAIPKPYPLAKVVSIGDILITLGLILFLQNEMQGSWSNSRNRMIKLGYRGKL